MTAPKHYTVGDREKLEARILKLRKALIRCGKAVGGGVSDDCSDDFLCYIPDEVDAWMEEFTKTNKEQAAMIAKNAELCVHVSTFLRETKEILDKK